MHASQVIMPYILNLHNAVCQLHLKKTGRKRRSGKAPRHKKGTQKLPGNPKDKYAPDMASWFLPSPSPTIHNKSPSWSTSSFKNPAFCLGREHGLWSQIPAHISMGDEFGQFWKAGITVPSWWWCHKEERWSIKADPLAGWSRWSTALAAESKEETTESTLNRTIILKEGLNASFSG